jgi:HlyD family secretion protein
LGKPTGVGNSGITLFKTDDKLAHFQMSHGRAVHGVGHRNGAEAEVLEGVVEGDAVVLYPNDKLKDGAAVK